MGSSLEEGKHELTINLYRKINIWFIEDGSPSAVFARAFLCLTWNLMCLVDSTDGACIKHLVGVKMLWEFDFLTQK